MKLPGITHVLFGLCLWGPALSPLAAEEVSFSLDDLRKEHPRLLASEADFARLQNPQWDDLGLNFMSFFRETGPAMLDLPPVEHKLQGRRLLHQARLFLKRVATWALLYRMDGDPVYRDRAIAEMEAAAAFPDWNPGHFLDTSEMMLGFAIGTDWLWGDLAPERKEHFLTALIEKGIRPSLDEEHPDNWWLDYNNNWNPVCHSGLVAGAIMIADRDPALAAKVIARAIEAVPYALGEYHPDGVYPEGPVYWGYGTTFTAILIDLLEHAFGRSYGLAGDEAFSKSVVFHSLSVSPTGRFYNFSDSREEVRFSPVTAWFASYYGNRAALYEMRRGLARNLEEQSWKPENTWGRDLPFLALWYPGASPQLSMPEHELPHNWLGNGPNPVAFVRESWGDPNAFYLAFKGGRGTNNHAHMDAGSFVFEDEGVRWAIELGSQQYQSLESKGLELFDRSQHSDRWRIFRLGPYSHNLLLIDQRLQRSEEKADITSFAEENGVVRATIDLTPVYHDQAAGYQRHIAAYDYQVLRITDRVRGTRQEATLRWRMLTRAVVDIRDDTAVLSQDGKTLYFKVAQPAEFILRSEAVDPPPYYYDAFNPGVNAIDVWSRVDRDGNRDIDILISAHPEALDAVLNTL